MGSVSDKSIYKAINMWCVASLIRVIMILVFVVRGDLDYSNKIKSNISQFTKYFIINMS